MHAPGMQEEFLKTKSTFRLIIVCSFYTFYPIGHLVRGFIPHTFYLVFGISLTVLALMGQLSLWVKFSPVDHWNKLTDFHSWLQNKQENDDYYVKNSTFYKTKTRQKIINVNRLPRHFLSSYETTVAEQAKAYLALHNFENQIKKIKEEGSHT